MTNQRGGRQAQGARLIVGLILLVQGFGSAITEANWHSSFGVAGLLHWAGAPNWTDLLIGTLGAGLLIWALIVARQPTR
jgi:hypothetical protein